MLSKKSSLSGALKALYVIPLVVISLVANAETRYEYVAEPVPVADAPVADSTAIDDDPPIPFQLLERRPTFQGGDANDFSVWVSKQLVYPKDAKDAGIQGRVTLSYTVNKDGSVSDVKVLRGVHPSLDAEAVRVISSSPKWDPGYQEGRPVTVTFAHPVIFQL